MLERVRKFVDEYDMLEPGDRVIAAVSGGADSVCLLSVLARIAPELSVSLRVVHVHHGLRGAEADRDEAYVRELCGRLQLPFTAVHRNVAAYAAERGLSTEEAGRILRYEALEEAAEAWDAEAGTGVEAAEPGLRREMGEPGQPPQPGRVAACAPRAAQKAKIAVAHHQEDQAETILHNLLRGSGLKGLSGIRPVQGRRIRPLLCVGRREILDYLREEKTDWCEDSTNASGDYTRNRIRGQLLPMMTELVNARAVENILRAGTVFAQADRYIESQAARVWDEAGAKTTAVSAQFPLDVFCRQEEIIRTYLVRRMLDEVAPGWKNITHRHFKQISELAFKQVGSRLDLPCGMEAEVGYETLLLRRRQETDRQGTGRQKMPDSPPQNVAIDPEIMKMSIFSREKGMEIPKNQYTKWFDYDKIRGTLSVRSRQEGDYLVLPGGGKKTVARYMIDEKIPRQQRGEIPVLAEGSHVLWVAGYRISEYYKITDNTKTVLQVTYDGGENHGR